MIEKLAELEHDQWVEWSHTIYQRLEKYRDEGRNLDFVLDSLLKRWGPNWIDYELLHEPIKEFDRIWARKVLEIVGQPVR